MDVEFLRYQFEDGYYGVIIKNGFKVGVRHIQMVYMLATSITLGFIRGSLGVAVLAVNDQTRVGDTYIQIYNWNHKIQGAVLSSFFFGYALALIPAELFLRRISGRLLSTAILLFNGALCVAMPTIINKGGWVAACNAKLCMGMIHACFYTANQSLFDQWLPPNERKIFKYIIYGGIQLGIIIAFPISGLLSTAPLGWELVYYSLAMLGLSMAIIVGTLTASSPAEHQAIGDLEKEFIGETLSYYRKKELSRPWGDILKSSKFWAVTCAHAASHAVFTLILAHMPAYLMVFEMSLQDSAWCTMLPFISMILVYMTVSPIVDWIYTLRFIRHLFSASFIRKIISGLGGFGIIIGLTMLSNFPNDWGCPAVAVLTAILGLLGFQFCGFLCAFKDMSENYSGTLMMISCTVSSVVGAAVPFTTGVILGDMSDSRHWRVVLLTMTSVYTVATIVYTSFSSHERQAWDHITKPRIGQYNGVKGVHQIQMKQYGHTNLGLQKGELDTAL